MKVHLDVTGMLTIAAETHTEGYALQKWSEDNVNENTPNITVTWDTTNYIKIT